MEEGVSLFCRGLHSDLEQVGKTDKGAVCNLRGGEPLLIGRMNFYLQVPLTQ